MAINMDPSETMQAEVISWIEKSLSSFKPKELPNCVPVLKSWQGRLSAVGDWYANKADEVQHFTDRIVQHYSDDKERLSEVDVVLHDHNYCFSKQMAVCMCMYSTKFFPHHCNSCCWKKGYQIDNWYEYNIREVPLRLGWQRVILCRTINSTSRQVDVYYIAPCGRRLRSMEEVFQFLVATTVDTVDISQFTFDHLCSPYTNCRSFTKVDVYVDDISFGKENRPISCVNTYNREFPDCLDTAKFEYTTCRSHEDNVRIPTDKEFMVCCSCTDDCVNRSQCECWQLTIQEAQFMREPKHSVGYVHHRLKRPQPSAIYECNKWCKCGPRCTNRVVQKGIQHRLQVFHTGKYELRWGLRTLDDIPKGDFVCIYNGHIYTEQGAEQKAIAYGDEYFADLDYIEVIEHHKEGYESDVAMSQCSSSDAIDQTSVCSMESLNSTDVESNPVLHNETLSISSASDSEVEQNLVLMEKEPAEGFTTVLTSSPRLAANADNFSLSNTLNLEVVSHQVPKAVSSPVVNTPSKPPKRFQGMKTRKHYHEETTYIMDAKTKGNVGRYINHSCSPNMFVQNVFIDTLDLRFPWVAFFAKRRIEAMSELTWDYNYDVGSVENKVIFCLCGAPNCKGRLL